MCKHLRRIGDNNGVSCMDCGAQLAGYGKGGNFPNCMHEWWAEKYMPYRICTYCEREEANPHYNPLLDISDHPNN